MYSQFTPHSLEWCKYHAPTHTHRESSVRFSSGFAHTAGRKSDYQTGQKVMEDVIMIHGSFANRPDCDLFGLFDGHEGSEAAIFAGRMFSTILEDNLKRIEQSLSEDIENEIILQAQYLDITPMQALDSSEHKRIILSLQKSFLSLTEQMRHNLTTNNSLSGTTALIAFFHANSLYVANVGDTRAVLATSPTKFERVSIDHRPDSKIERERIESTGGRVETIVGSVPRVNGCLAVSRALGNVELEGNGVISTPSIRVIENVFENQYMILASDGLWDNITEQEVVSFVGKQLGYVQVFVPRWKQRQIEEEKQKQKQKDLEKKERKKERKLLKKNQKETNRSRGESVDMTFKFDEEEVNNNNNNHNNHNNHHQNNHQNNDSDSSDDDDEEEEEEEDDNNNKKNNNKNKNNNNEEKGEKESEGENLETKISKKLAQMAYERKSLDNISVIVLNLGKKNKK